MGKGVILLLSCRFLQRNLDKLHTQSELWNFLRLLRVAFSKTKLDLCYTQRLHREAHYTSGIAGLDGPRPLPSAVPRKKGVAEAWGRFRPLTLVDTTCLCSAAGVINFETKTVFSCRGEYPMVIRIPITIQILVPKGNAHSCNVSIYTVGRRANRQFSSLFLCVITTGKLFI